MTIFAKAALPVFLGVSLCGVTAVVVYFLLKKEDEDDVGAQNSNMKIKRQRSVLVEKKIPLNLAAAFIGRSGSHIKSIEEKSGAHIKLNQGGIEQTKERTCLISGPTAAVQIAVELVDEFIANQPIIEDKTVTVPQWACGRIIGTGGKNIHDISRTSSAKVTLESRNQDTNPNALRQVIVKGTKEQITRAVEMVEKAVAQEKCNRESAMATRAPRGAVASTIGSPTWSDSSASSQVAEAVSTNLSETGACLEVVVSAVSSPSKFWLQLCGPQTDKLDALVEQMTEYYSNKDNQELHLLQDVQVGQIVAAVFRHDGRWYRAQVTEIKKNEFDPTQLVADLLFVDYGDCEYVAVKELFELRTDMLRLKFQAIECFLAGVAPVGSEDAVHHSCDKWHPKATELFFELTQAARWKKLLSRTCSFRERPLISSAAVCGGIASVGRTARGLGDEPLVPGVKLYDILEDGTEVDIGAQLVSEGWAIEADEQSKPSSPPATPPLTPHAPNTPFGDLEVSRVLGMFADIEDNSTAHLKHGEQPGDRVAALKSASISKSSSVSSFHDDTNHGQIPALSSHADLSYPRDGSHANGSAQNGHDAFLQTERNEIENASLPMHRVDSRDELKAKVNRIHSSHNLHTMDR